MAAASRPATAHERADLARDAVHRLGVDRWLLPVYVVGVTLYLVLPVAVMIAVQLQRPGRALQPHMGRVLASTPG